MTVSLEDENLEGKTANTPADNKITNAVGGKGKIQRTMRQVGW